MGARDVVLSLKERMGRAIIGQEQVVERLLLTLLCNGNLLLEGMPGLAKTRAVRALAGNLEADYRRIQFTPDLLPSDITGAEVYYSEDGEGKFKFDPGPIFANLVLADEINRAPAKVQAALLEAMEERQVTVAGVTHDLPPLFMVLATQNPIEQEGTYPLPEAQMDRFLMHVMIRYPDLESEVKVIALVRGEERVRTGGEQEKPDLIPQQAVFDARAEIHQVQVAPAIDQYIVALIDATRNGEKYSEELGAWIDVGASPRGGISIDKAARANAWLKGRDHVTPDDVRAVAHDCLRHRLILGYEATADGITPDAVIKEIISQVAVV